MTNGFFLRENLSCFVFIAAGSGDTVIALLSKFWINEEVNKIELGY